MPTQQKKIVHLVDSGQKTAADSARLFNVHPSTVARLLARSKPTNSWAAWGKSLACCFSSAVSTPNAPQQRKWQKSSE
jgi:hypothetical protein